MPARPVFLPVAFLLAAGCTGNQISEPAPTAAAEILVTTLALAADEDAEDKRREYAPGEWTYCDVGCRFQRQLTRDGVRETAARRQRRLQTQRLRTEFDAFMKDPENTDQESRHPSLSVVRGDRPLD